MSNELKNCSPIQKILDEGSMSFLDDSDTQNILDSWYRGFHSTGELIDRLVFLRKIHEQRAERRVMGPQDPDDAYARVGTWDNNDDPEAA